MAAERIEQSSVDSPEYAVIANQLLKLIEGSKAAGMDQDTIRAALQAFTDVSRLSVNFPR